MYPLSKQDTFVSNIDRLGETSPAVADAFRRIRVAADEYGPLDPKQRELCLLAGFAATKAASGFTARARPRPARRSGKSSRSSSSCWAPPWVLFPWSRHSAGFMTS